MFKRMSTEEKIISVMEEKYGEEFQFLKWSFQDVSGHDRKAQVECGALPGKEIEVVWTEDKTGKTACFDNYMGYLYENEISERLKEAAKKICPESRIFFNVQSSLFPQYMGPEMKIEDILQDKNTQLSVVVIWLQKENQELKEVQMERWRQELEKMNLCAAGSLFITDNPEDIESIDEDNFYQWTQEEGWYQERCYFAMDTSYEFYYTDWR